MTTSSSPGPDDHDALAPWERQVLADIEDDLSASDPRLADEMSWYAAGRAQHWWPLSVRSTCLLFIALTVLVLVGALLPTSWWAVVGVVTTLVVLPWLLLAATEKNQPD